jgi:uncharacterized protein YpmS
MNLLNLELYQILVIINFIVAFLLLAYGIYLVGIEKNYRKKENQLDKIASQIVTEANKKALNILKDSNYLSEELKNELDNNFDIILDDLKSESADFYKEIENEYIKSTEKFAHLIEKKAESEIEQLSEKISSDTVEAQQEFQKIYEIELKKAMDEISAYKVSQKEEFNRVMNEKIAELTKELLPLQISIEDQEKLVEEVINRAYKEGVFN